MATTSTGLLAQTYKPATGTASTMTGTGYTAQTGTASGYTADQWKVDPNQTVQSQVNQIIAQDSPLMQQAATTAMQGMNGRGLANSSMAVGAGQNAVIGAAMPMAQQDASTYADAAKTNTGWRNEANQFNTAAKNQFGLANMDAVNASRAFTANASNSAAANNMQAKNNMTLANMDSTNQAGQFNAGEANKFTLQKSDQQFTAGQNDLNRKFQTSERLGSQQFTSGENKLNRAFQTSERLGGQQFTAGQNTLDRTQQTNLQKSQQTFQASQASLDRALQTNLANMSKDTQMKISQLNRDASQLSQLSSTANTLYNNFSSAAQAILVSDLTPEAKETTINQMATLMTAGMQIQGSINGDVDMTTLIDEIFGS